MADVWLPTYMQSLTGGQQRVRAGGHTVRQLIDDLEHQYPGLKARLYDEEEDSLMPGLAVVVDGDASLIGLLEQVREDSEVHFLPAIGGG
ncbi:MAG: MoaD/ThiS family protein [Candidatus Tectimicrobiota bacterium]